MKGSGIAAEAMTTAVYAASYFSPDFLSIDI
jgi:hypothetical protein